MTKLYIGKIVNTHGIKGELRIKDNLTVRQKNEIFKVGGLFMFELSDVKKYVYCPVSTINKKKIYISKDLNKILRKTGGLLVSVYAALEMPNGLTLFTMDFSYSDEPLIMHRFMHIDSFMKFNNDREIVYL